MANRVPRKVVADGFVVANADALAAALNASGCARARVVETPEWAGPAAALNSVLADLPSNSIAAAMPWGLALAPGRPTSVFVAYEQTARAYGRPLAAFAHLEGAPWPLVLFDVDAWRARPLDGGYLLAGGIAAALSADTAVEMRDWGTRFAVLSPRGSSAETGSRRFRDADLPTTGPRGCRAATPWRRVAAPPRPRRGYYSVDTRRGDAAAATWIFGGEKSRAS